MQTLDITLTAHFDGLQVRDSNSSEPTEHISWASIRQQQSSHAIHLCVSEREGFGGWALLSGTSAKLLLALLRSWNGFGCWGPASSPS